MRWTRVVAAVSGGDWNGAASRMNTAKRPVASRARQVRTKPGDAQFAVIVVSAREVAKGYGCGDKPVPVPPLTMLGVPVRMLSPASNRPSSDCHEVFRAVRVLFARL